MASGASMVSPIAAAPSHSAGGVRIAPRDISISFPTEAVELDGSPISPGVMAKMVSPLSTDGAGRQINQDQAKLRSERERDLAILVNIPDSPAAQDYEVAEYNSSKGLKTNT